jgi:hypothetical protein
MERADLANLNFTNNVRRWRIDPAYWVKCFFEDKIKLNNHQLKACKELGKLVAAKLALGVGRKLEGEQLRYSKCIGLDISSGMGTGKDFWVSLMMYWHHTVFPIEDGQAPHGLATANTATQLNNVLWRQASAHPALSKKMPDGTPILEKMFVHQRKKIYRSEFDGSRFFFEAVTINPNASSDEQAAALTGRHAPYMLMILDEAAGIPEPVFENLEGTLTGMMNIIIMIYNPIRSRGYAVQARNNPERWIHMNWNAEDTVFGDTKYDRPLQNNISGLLKKYGYNSNAYRIRVLGLPPLDDKDLFIPWDWVQNAVGKEFERTGNEPVIMGIDPGAGGDKTAIAIREGCTITDIYTFNTPRPSVLAEKAAEIYIKHQPDAVNLDAIGIGWGIEEIDFFKKIRKKIHLIDVREKARDRKKYKLVRDELWGTVKEKFEKGLISLPNHYELINQFGSIKVKGYTPQGGVNLPDKKSMKKDVGHSPDEADAVVLCYGVPDFLLAKGMGEYDEEDDYDELENYNVGPTGY